MTSAAKARELARELDAYARTAARIEAETDLALKDERTDPRKAYKLLAERRSEWTG